MKKDDTTLASIFCMVLILLMLVFLFAIWGGDPRGVYWKIEDLKREAKIQNTKIQMLIDYQKVQEIMMQDKENKIEILRTQVNQLSLKKWHR